ncbi:hypothetical protein PoB_004359500 [Plakobranchus ocellatus]|uniref:Uncharacterized protein n=1 Tax=Plakobranchus ocellatus TaxID=259542 RepID=A0AAV4BC24_9GAST|nr:hypothetical protein PoB_004359500 [Plakobranchus ocellatus]
MHFAGIEETEDERKKQTVERRLAIHPGVLPLVRYKTFRNVPGVRFRALPALISNIFARTEKLGSAVLWYVCLGTMIGMGISFVPDTLSMIWSGDQVQN